METIQLINGQFTPDEAKEVLLGVINHKIDFHSLKSFSAHIRFNRTDTKAEARIQQLRADREKVLNLLEIAKAAGYDLRLSSTIHIAFEPLQQSSAPCSEAENS